jgi:diguanylate cyclase (GGDEF)-like protein/PAS domain S-box-containing protein
MNNNSPIAPSDFFLFSSALMCVLDADGMIVQLNSAWEKRFHLSHSDIEQSHFLNWVHSDDKANSSNQLAQLGIGSPLTSTSKTIPVNFSNRWRDSGGEYHRLHWEINAAISPITQKTLFYAVATHAGAEKQHLEERFELAIQGYHHGLWDWNLKTNEIYLSPRWKQMLGYQEHEINNTLDDWCHFVHTDDYAKMWQQREAYLDKRISRYEYIYRVYHRDGSVRWVVERAAALWDKKDQPYRMVGTDIDITKRQQIEEALQEQKALLSAIFNVTKIGLCVIDEQDRFVRVNPAYCQMIGYREEELLGQAFTTFFSIEPKKQLIDPPQELSELQHEGEWRIPNKAGQSLDISFTRGFLTQQNGQRFQVMTMTDMTQRKSLELERNRLFNLSLDLQSIIGFDMSFKEINAAWERTLGWSKAELLEKSALSLVHPQDQDVSLKTIQQLTQGKKIFGFENRYLCKDGTYKWLSWNVYPLVDQQTMYVVTRDITDKKQAEKEIQRSQAFIRLVVDSVPHLIFIKDYSGRFIFVNQAVTDFLGCRMKQLINPDKPTVSLELQSTEELYSETEQQVIEQMQEITTIETYHHADGQPRVFHLIKKPFIQNDGQVLVLSVGTDITERQQQETALKHSEARYRAIVEHQTDLVCRYLPDGILTFVNQAYCRYFDKSEDELVGHCFISFLSQNERLLLQKSLAKVTPTQPVAMTEHSLTRADGTTGWQQWFFRALFDDNGRVIEYQGVGRDITERKQAEEALRQSEERLRLVTSAAPVILFATDHQAMLTFIRGKALQLFHLNDDELVGQSVFDALADLPKSIEDIRRALAGESTSHVITLPDVALETKLTPLLDEEQRVIGVIGISIDITERYQLELQLKEAIAELETILENSVIGIAYVKNGFFVRVNQKLELLLGYDSDELSGLPFQNIYPNTEEYQRMEQPAYQRLSLGKEYNAQTRITTKQKNTFWARMVGKAVNPNDLEQGSIWLIEDITVQKKAEQDLRLTAAVFETSANGIFVTDSQNRMVRVNPAFSKITGYTADEVYGQSSGCLASGQHSRKFYQQMWDSINQTGHWQGEIWNRKKNGEVYVAWLSISTITNEQGELVQYMAILTDISSLQENIEQVRYLANYDSLTQLPNRLLFHDKLLQAKKMAKSHKKSFALLFIDLDGFKPVNDNLGHALGDQLLQQVAARLLSSVKDTDTVARLGGDEFTVILNLLKTAQQGSEVAAEIIQCLQQPFQIAEHQIKISASIGISVYPGDSKDIDMLVQYADTAMYEAKHAGKGRYRFYHPPMKDCPTSGINY